MCFRGPGSTSTPPLTTVTERVRAVRKLYAAADLPEAYLVLHRLTEAGITAHVFNENAQGGVGELPFTHTYPEVWLEDEADWQRGREIVRQHESRPAERGERHCGRCGEDNPGTFEVCWRCGEPI